MSNSDEESPDSSSVNTFADAVSETFSNENMSLSSVLPNTTQSSVAKRRHTASNQLLDSVGGEDDSKFTTKLAGWVKNAANFIASETRPANVGSLRRSSSGNIIQRVNTNTPSASPQPRVIDATDSICSYPDCVQSLNIAVSRFHCRRCNGWYCAIHAGHASLGMKLVPGTGEPNSEVGVWSRVCQRCFLERHRPGLLVYRDQTLAYVEKRKGYLNKVQKQSELLQERLLKLGEFKQTRKVPFRVFEQQLVQWQEDREVTHCFSCRSKFSTVNRKHHCRLCGRVICGETNCSLFYPLKIVDGDAIDLRVCCECENMAIRRPFLLKDLREKSPLEPLYQRLRQCRLQIVDILPRFNEQLFRFEHEMDSDEPSEQRVLDARHEAMAARETVMVVFREIQDLIHKIKDLYDEDTQEAHLCNNIHRSAIMYLQNNMFTLQMLPKLDLKRMQKPSQQTLPSATPSGHSSIASSFLPKFFSSLIDDTEQQSIPPPANLPALEEKLEVLLEQKEQLEGYLTDEVQRQQFDNVRALRASLEEVSREIQSIQRVFKRFE